MPPIQGSRATTGNDPRVAFSLLKRWTLGTYHGLRRKHVDAYLNEFVFRYNRHFHRHVSFEKVLGLAARGGPRDLPRHRRPRRQTRQAEVRNDLLPESSGINLLDPPFWWSRYSRRIRHARSRRSSHLLSGRHSINVEQNSARSTRSIHCPDKFGERRELPSAVGSRSSPSGPRDCGPPRRSMTAKACATCRRASNPRAREVVSQGVV
jgi:ISXO2-like transposase domain